MAPRPPKAKADKISDKPTGKRTTSFTTVASADNSVASSPMKPKTEKAKVEKKPAAEKKTTKAKVEKIEKALKETKDWDGKAVKVEKVKVEKKAAVTAKDGDKVDKATGEEAEKVILQYLKEQNRPYSATDITANLRGRVTKTVADKLLKEMEQAGKIMAKATNGDKKGSQWVFWCLQDPADSATPEELTTMDTAITTLREITLPPLRTQLKALTQKLSTVLSSPSTRDLSVQVSNLQASNADRREKLQELREMVEGGKGIMKEESERVEKEWRFWKGKEALRKRCFREVEAVLLEGMGREDLWERAGLEAVGLND